MLQFFRKYQKFVFIVITVVIGISFVFFGTFTAGPSPEKKEDRVLTKSLDGFPIMQSTVEHMAYFLSSSYLDGFDRSSRKNLLNDGVIEKDFLATKLGEVITQQYLKEVQRDLENTWKKAKTFRPYVHPKAPFLHAELIWESYFPDLHEHFKSLQTEEWSPKSFSLLGDLYVDQVRFPPELLRRVLMYQQNQYSWIGEDPELQTKNLALFGLHSLEEWFGRKWIELVSQVIINVAIEAEKKGYVVTEQESEASLIQNVYDALKQLDPKTSYTYSDAYGYFQNQSRQMGLDTKETVALWQKVLLFRRLFDDAGGAVFVDPFTYKNFSDYAKEQASVDLYQLPKEFCFHDFRSILKGQIYFDSLRKVPAATNVLEVPLEICQVQQIEKTYPEFVQRRFVILLSKAEKKQLTQKIALKDLWKWQMQDENWETILKEFPEIAHRNIEGQDRFSFLEGLEKTLRTKIDSFASMQMIPDDSVREQLVKTPPQTQTVFFRSSGGKIPFSGISSHEELLHLLESAPLKGQTEISDEQKNVQERLSFFTQDSLNFYQIEVVECSSEKEIVPFKELALDGTLDQLLDKKLEEQYNVFLRKNHAALQKTDGSKKSFTEAKNEIATLVYGSVLQALKEEYRLTATEVKDESPDFYAKYRFCSYLNQAKKELEAEGRSDLVAGEEEKDQLAWKVQKVSKELERSKKNPWIGEQIFTMPLNSWSNIQLVEDDALGFFELQAREHPQETFQKLDEEQSLLALEVKKLLMEQLLIKIAEKKSVIFLERE